MCIRDSFLKGFCPAALQLLLTTVAKWGEFGLASKHFPVNRSLLMSPEILTSTSFTKSRDKESVPAWRDGAAGSSLQMAMEIAVDKRMFEYELYKTNSEAFKLWTSMFCLTRCARMVITNCTSDCPSEHVRIKSN